MAGIPHSRWYLLSAAAIAADRISKYALEHLTPEGYRHALIPRLLDLVHTHNSGVAFGMLSESSSSWVHWGLVGFSIAVIGLVSVLLARNDFGPARQNAGLALILGGALGNLVDRLAGDGVLDFADFYIGAHHWPAFNVADSCIVIGAGLVMLELLLERPRAKT